MNKRRWLFRSCVVAAIVVPVPAILAYGCSTTEYDDLCGWTKDPNNCYREFFIDIGVSCGATGQTKAGEFAARDKLDLCILAEGGQVVFEPAIDLLNPPPDNVEPIKVKLINPDTTLCGTIEFRAKYDFTIKIEGDPLPDAGVDGTDLPEEFITGGTFDMTGGKATDSLAVTCPGGSAFNFDRLQIANCTEAEPILPHMEVDFSAGGIEQNGVIRLWVYYPPQEGDLDCKLVDGQSTCVPTPINYAECFIPAAPPLCENGVKDGSETDVDCGGTFCATRCQDAQLCINNDDCASDVCGLNMGIKMCAGP